VKLIGYIIGGLVIAVIFGLLIHGGHPSCAYQPAGSAARRWAISRCVSNPA